MTRRAPWYLVLTLAAAALVVVAVTVNAQPAVVDGAYPAQDNSADYGMGTGGMVDAARWLGEHLAGCKQCQEWLGSFQNFGG